MQITQENQFPDLRTRDNPLIQIILNSKNKIDKDIAWQQLFENYERFIFREISKYIKNHEDIQDEINNIKTLWIKNIQEFNIEKPLMPWLYTLCKNNGLNYIKKYKSKNVLINASSLDDEENDFILNKYKNYSEKKINPFYIIIEKEKKAIISACIEYMKEDEKEILNLRFFHHKSYEQITKILDIPSGTVMSRLHKAKQNFKKIYETVLQEIN